MKKSVLAVDDDPVILSLLRHLIENSGLSFTGATRVDEARRLALRNTPHAAIVDLTLGGDDGLDLVRLWRVERKFPVLILSARNQPVDRIVGLEMGADDYISKPFEPRELLLRLRVALERWQGLMPRHETPSKWSVGIAIFDAAVRALRFGTQSIPLTTAEFRLIDLLVRHPHEVLTRDQIMDSVHLRDRHFATDRSVDMLIARFRAKTRDLGLHIEAIRGSGYMLCADVERLV